VELSPFKVDELREMKYKEQLALRLLRSHPELSSIEARARAEIAVNQFGVPSNFVPDPPPAVSVVPSSITAPGFALLLYGSPTGAPTTELNTLTSYFEQALFEGIITRSSHRPL
jgi:hypothetical protein